ncbi:MAG TPA: hypothetical protein PKL77_03980 [Candidatus Omnitrophota bacterium]|mgnify:CR=1 FL=1|nr:hypothetical protein [Candidatus Omnitrophota bacterium]HPT07796.1 hypothetical protein [Candidatus Omnitrophota bacterium]
MRSLLVFFVFIFVLFAGQGFAQDTKLGKTETVKAKSVAPIHQVTLKQVQGEVAGIGKKYISVTFARDAASGAESEIMIPFNPKTVKLDHLRSLSDLEPGDQVRVQFNEEIKKDETQDKTNFEAKVISLIKKGVKKPAPSEEDVLKSAEVAEEQQ